VSQVSIPLVVFEDPFHSEEDSEIVREVTLSNRDWAIISQALESFSYTFRTNQSQVIATYVTRGQLGVAEEEATRMNSLLQVLDKIHSKIL
jgi:hypothetical protein